MKRKRNAYEVETGAAAAAPPPNRSFGVYSGEAMAMLARRGLHPEKTTGNALFPNPPEDPLADNLSEWLGHYAFRLFLRGAIQESSGFLPSETTRYLTPEQSRNYAEVLVRLDLAEKMPRNRYRMTWAVENFGGILEWYIGRELERRYGFDVVTGVQLHARGTGGDLDVVAAAEGKLVYVEAKSSPPRNLAASEMAAFCERLNLLRPDVALFVVDTALRLSDKVLPMLMEEFQRHGRIVSKPRRIAAQSWALTPHVYAVNGSRDLMGNIGKALAAGFLALSPP